MRPLNAKEVQQNDVSIIETVKPNVVVIRPDVLSGAVGVANSMGQSQSAFNQSLTPKSYTFNAIFDENDNQAETMERSGVGRIVQLALEGYSTTVFCYGQTGSGKTHTLTGPPHLVHNY